MSDYEQFLSPISADQPSGANLEYDLRFLEFERACQGKPEQRMGNQTRHAEPPNWAEVRRLAERLLAVARDLRIAVPLCLARLHTDGFPGLASGLTLVRGLIEHQWQSVYPHLDAEDHDDPTIRMNALAALAAPESMLLTVRESKVVRSRALGRQFGLRDFRIASGEIKPGASDKEPARMEQIEGAFAEEFKENQLQAVRATAAGVTVSIEQVTALDQILADKVGARAPNLAPLANELEKLKAILAERVAALVGEDDLGVVGQPQAAGISVGGGRGAPRSREEVVRMLDQICDYYRAQEPSSPVPLLLERAKRLVPKNFLEIIGDLTPAGLSEAEGIAGVEKK